MLARVTYAKEHVMIFRAVFWIGLVSLLAPHEPDLGLGRPGAGTLQPSSTTLQSAVQGLSRLDDDCGSACAGDLGLSGLMHLRDNRSIIAGLAEVKAEIAADQRAREVRRHDVASRQGAEAS
jgi:hypothetical protein